MFKSVVTKIDTMGVRFKPGDDIASDLTRQREVNFNGDKFLEDVLSDDYLLLAGSEVIMNRSIIPSGDINDYLLKQINHILNRNYPSYQDMMEDAAASGVDEIRNLLNADWFEYNLDEDFCPELRALLETRAFNVVLTITFDGYLETLMRLIWGERLRVVNIDDKTSLDDFRNALAGCRNGNKYNQPTLFYIFGKAVRDESKKYVRTDDDAIKIIEKWMTMPREDPILNFIRNKQILALGCKYENWYFRFFWYILKRDTSQLCGGQVAFMLDEGDRADAQLKKFLVRSRICRHPDAREFMSGMTAKIKQSGELIKKKRSSGGVFISYCNKNVVQAEKLFFALKNRGYSVWMDIKNNLGEYDEDIGKAIASSSSFLPLLTPCIAEDLESNSMDHYYCKEWKIARQYEIPVRPIAVDGYDLRAEYHSVFESIAGRYSGVDLMEKDGMEKLIDKLDQDK